MSKKSSSTPVKGWMVKLALTLVVLIGAWLSTKVVSTEDADAAAGDQFDAVSYVQERYDEKLLPSLLEQATPLPELLTALAGDAEDSVKDEYGHSPGPSSAYAFAVTGTAVAGKPVGSLLPITIEGVPSEFKVQLQVGPAINGTALRDATGEVKFNEFLNQLEFQRVATELNNRAKSTALADLDVASLEGKTITFTGAFTQTKTGLVSIVPIELEVS